MQCMYGNSIFSSYFTGAVDAVNELYASLGSPDLCGWAASGGDPCEEARQGVQCLGPNITEMLAVLSESLVPCRASCTSQFTEKLFAEPDRVLKGVGLEGKLSEALGKLTAVTRLFVNLHHISVLLSFYYHFSLFIDIVFGLCSCRDLSSNNLAGELPESMAMLKSLSALWVAEYYAS